MYSSLLQETVINFRLSFGVVNMPMYEIYFKYFFSSMQNIESFPFKCETRLFGENKRDLKEYPKIIQSFLLSTKKTTHHPSNNRSQDFYRLYLLLC